MDLLDVLRRQASRFQCPECGKSLADCRLDLIAQADAQSLVRVTCTHCEHARMIAVAVETPAAEAIEAPVRDQPIEGLGTVITTDEVLDIRLALAAYDGDLKGLIS
jgi:ribosomal protein S27E